MKLRTTLLALLLASTTVAAGCSSAQAQSRGDSGSSTTPINAMRSITVEGVGSSRVEPNEAVATFQFQAQAQELRAAHRTVQAQVQEFVDAVVEAGWDRDKVRQSSMNYHPNYDYVQGQGQVFRNFQASVTLTIRTDELSDVPAILDLAIDHGVSQIQPVRYTVSDEQEQASDARLQAIANARAKAEELAEAAGASLGDVLSISEGQSGSSPAPRMMAMESRASSDGFADVSPNTVELSSYLVVTWELR